MPAWNPRLVPRLYRHLYRPLLGGGVWNDAVSYGGVYTGLHYANVFWYRHIIRPASVYGMRSPPRTEKRA